jgi:Tfp pilus assembly protein PilE
VSLEGQFESLTTNQDVSAGNNSHQEAIAKLHEILGLMEQFHQKTKTQLDMASSTYEAQRLMMSTLESIGQKLSIQQPALLQGQYEVNAVIRRFQTCQQESLALVKQLRGEIADQNSETPEILENIKSGEDILSEIQRGIQSSLRHMDKHLATYHSDIQTPIKAFNSMTTAQGRQYGAFHTTRYMSAENPDLLSKLIRAELKQTLEPISSLDEKLDKIIGHLVQTASKSAHEKTFIDFPSTETAISSKASTQALQSTSCTSVRQVDIFPTTAHPVPLFVVDRAIRSTLGVVKIRTLSLRSRSNFACPPERFFTVTVDFWPLPKWNSHGLSAMFSSGRNSHGYYEICPSILPFRVWSETDLLWQIIDNDDIGALQKMLATRVTLRDAHTLGFNLLQVRSVVNDEFY